MHATLCPQARPFSVKASEEVPFLTQGKAEAGRKVVLCHPREGPWVVFSCVMSC